ncbi:MAG: proton-conducting transporter membrane subunit [Bryobacterales bacterium]|nr:proton-conducting transporter membrane subunit [Bryobacterales bacterium]
MEKASARVPLYSRLVVALPAGLFVWFASMVPSVAGGEAQFASIGWLPQLGVDLAFHVDGLGLLFALLITGVGTFILLYASEYMRGHPQVGRFTAFLVAFMLSMLGVVLSDNLIVLFVFWELTTLTSFLLIGYSHGDSAARRAALQSLIVTGAGALAMLAGFVLLGNAAGSYSLREMLAGDSDLAGHPAYVAMLVLVLAGAFTKSAQFPFHFWLPNAMAAPTPVSAYLHSATMVKAGVFLLARLNPVLGGTDEWGMTLTGFGAFTAVYSAAVALTRTDLKQILAYTTLMALGVCVMFIGLPQSRGADEVPLGAVAAVAFVFVHALYKAPLFMVAGTIDHSAGTRDIRSLGGLRKAMPWSLLAAALAALSMSGVPPFAGFVGKEILYSSAIGSTYGVAATAAIVTANAMIVSAALLVVAVPFLGQSPATRPTPHEGRWPMWIGSLVLGVAALGAGLFPRLAFEWLLLPAAGAVAGRQPHFEASLWHGFNLPFALSVVTLSAGALAYWQRNRLTGALGSALARLPVTGDSAYDWLMNGIARVSVVHTRIVQCGIQRRYLLIVFATLGASVLTTLVVKGVIAWPARIPDVSFVEWLLAILIAASALVTIRSHSRLMAIVALGVVGTGIALIFLLHGASDVAMTQLMVETLVVVIVAMVLLKLPGFRREVRQTGLGRWRDAIVSCVVGLTTTLVLLAVTAEPSHRRLTEYFQKTAVPEGFGANVVNVILVDFRGLDTLGEISVLAIAAVSAYTLINWRPRRSARAAARSKAFPEAEGAAKPETLS